MDKISVVRNFRITAQDGKEYNTNFYNLDVIISVGYRVKSIRGTAFRRWATKTLKEYILKGYAINQRFERIENFDVEIERRVTVTEHEIAKTISYIEAFLVNYNEINANTRMQLEKINQVLI